jgi:PAS domain S-box-containing protein
VQSFENHVGSITIDQEGYFWLGSWYGGLSRFDPDTGQFVHYRHNTEQIDSLASDAVWSVLEDQDGTLWVGTANALDRLNRDSGTFTHYTESDGLASSALRCMQESKQGDLWISTLNGLSQFDPRDETVTNYDVTDGLQSNEFLYDACHQSSQGELFFGGPKGLNAFFPAQITTNSYQPPVLLTTMRLFNEPVGVGDAHLERPIWDTEHLTLAPDDAVVSFEFAALSYAAPQHNRYQYMLKGYEEQWNTVDSRRRFATYTNLPAGSYTLRVRGSNDDGIWSDAEIALNITVLPAWWETWWFRLAVAAAIIALIIGSIRWRLAAIRKHARLLEQQVAERTEALRISNEQLREAEANLARAHSVAGLGSWEWDMQEQVTWSEMMYHLYGQDPQQFEPQLDSIMRIVHPDDRDTTTALIRGMLEHRQPVTYTHRVCLADGSIRYHYGRCELFCDSEGNPQRIVGTVQDITDHTKQEQQLLEQHKALTILRERERLARELHDNLGQVLGYVHTQAQAVHEALAVNKVPFAMQMIEQITDAARHVLADIREYILGVQVGISLQPDAVQSVPQGAFLSSLETYLHEFEHATGILVTLDAPDAARETNFPPTVEAHLLRVIQEALTNIRKHARASSVDMRLLLHQTSETASDAEDEEDTEDLSHLVVTITDDGIGFLPSSLDRHTASTGNGFGLTSMRGRVTELGGTLDIDSAPNQGTTLTIQVPLQRHSAGGYHSARVLLADNNDLFLQGLHNLLASNGFQVVGMTNSGCDALEQARTLKPDVVLIDVHMPDINGLEATRRIKAELPDMQIVMLTVSDDDAHIFEAIRAGASGYLLKNLESEQLCTQLHKLLQGEVPLSSKVTSRILKALAQQEPVVSSDTASPPADSSTLSEQNITILSLVAQGYTYKRVAEMLNYSEVTIKRHMRSIIRKLRVTNRADAIAYARERIERGEWPEPDLDNITSE